MKGQIEVVAVVFAAMFLFGGILGLVSLPEFPGRFFVSGFLVAVFSTGAGTLILKGVFSR